jgi:hypothetical protein
LTLKLNHRRVFTTKYIYNGDGVRAAQIENGLRTDYVQDVAAALPQVLTAQQGGTVSKYPSISLRTSLHGLFGRMKYEGGRMKKKIHPSAFILS